MLMFILLALLALQGKFVTAAPPSPSVATSNAPPDPRAERAKLRAPVRDIIFGTYRHADNGGCCSIYPGDGDTIVLRNEAGARIVMKLSEEDPYELIRVSQLEWGADVNKASVFIAPDGIRLEFRHGNGSRDAWVSPRR
jgi:hypothetical protein